MKKTWIIIAILMLTGLVGLAIWRFAPVKNDEQETKSYASTEDSKEINTSIPFEPGIAADQQFGFLIGPSADEMKLARETGAGWVRPHPGVFVWDYMQSSADSSYDFTETDQMVADAQYYDINMLPTIWHYSSWDQAANPDSANCKVTGSEFVNEFGWYRCNPYHWDKYTDWVTAVIERYDGDGTNDMPGLTQPVKYWEVMNEPDIRPMPGEEEGLQFFVGDSDDYAELLKRTSGAIRAADPNAKVLIAGAAGDNDSFLNFFRGVFKDTETITAFDIANIHCISSGDVDSFNVEPYAAMLNEFGINKPIWVTEAEAFVSSDPDEIAAQLMASSANAFAADAEKIFFTSMNINRIPGKNDKDEKAKDDDLQASTEIYQPIFKAL